LTESPNFIWISISSDKRNWRYHIFVAFSEYKNITFQLMQILDLLGMFVLWCRSSICHEFFNITLLLLLRIFIKKELGQISILGTNELKIRKKALQAFLDFRGFNFRDFLFNLVYNFIVFFSPLVLLLSNLDLWGFRLPQFFICPLINSINRGMPVLLCI